MSFFTTAMQVVQRTHSFIFHGGGYAWHKTVQSTPIHVALHWNANTNLHRIVHYHWTAPMTTATVMAMATIKKSKVIKAFHGWCVALSIRANRANRTNAITLSKPWNCVNCTRIEVIVTMMHLNAYSIDRHMFSSYFSQRNSEKEKRSQLQNRLLRAPFSVQQMKEKQ